MVCVRTFLGQSLCLFQMFKGSSTTFCGADLVSAIRKSSSKCITPTVCRDRPPQAARKMIVQIERPVKSGGKQWGGLLKASGYSVVDVKNRVVVRAVTPYFRSH